MPLALARLVLRLDNMKWFHGLAISAILAAPSLAAQVQVEVDLDQKQYLVREPIIAAVRIVNFAGQTLTMGRTPDWLIFDVEAANGSYLRKIGDPPVVHEFEVPNAARATRRVNIAPYFDLVDRGRYKLIATVRIPELNLEATSSPAYLNIIRGAPLWRQPFGWRPVIDGEVQPTQIRHYSLVQAMSGKQISLYARVSDETDSEIYRVQLLGRLLTFSRPEAQIDRESRLHVLWQIGAQQFRYTQLDPSGQLLVRHTYQYTSTRPRIRSNQSGQVVVAGGIRLKSSTDYPPKRGSGDDPEESGRDAAFPTFSLPTEQQPEPEETDDERN